MKTFLLLLAVSLTASEKLDRTYLPPPGAKFSGGVPGNIEVPLEFPKESYSPTQRPQGTLNGRPVVPGDTEIEVGINRGLGSQAPGFDVDSGLITPSSKAPFDYFQKVPTTTTSYAFTQTTTHPPSDGFDATLGPINTATGFPTTSPFIDFQTSTPGFQRIPGYQPPNLIAQQPGLISVQQPGSISSQYPGSTIATPTPGSSFVGESRPGLNQGDLNQYQVDVNRPGIIPGTSVARPGFVSQVPEQNVGQYQINQRPGISNIGQQSTIAPSISPQGTTPGFPQYGNNLEGNLITSTPGTNIYPQGTTPGLLPSGSIDENIQNFVPNAGISQDNLTPGQQLGPQGFVQPGNNIQLGQRPTQNQYQFNKDGEPVSSFPQTQYPGQQQSNAPLLPQQYPSQIDQFGRPISGQEQTLSTISSTTLNPDYSQSPTTPGAFPTRYPTGSFPSSHVPPGTGQLRSGLISRPERPQAESDRNAEILNYDNVINPDGYFAYSFDTSNGIHADESGNATDGVRANGSYSYIGDDGKLYSIIYTADENGYRPQGDHLPTPPPIPEAIQKVIEQVTRDKELGISDDGTYDEAKYGHKKFQGGRRPLKTNKMNIDESSIPDADEGQFDLVDRNQQARPHTGTRKPISFNGDTTNKYGENINEQDQPSSSDDLDNQEEGQTINKIPTRRPSYRFPGQKEEKYTSDLNAGDSSDRKRPVGKLPSRRPILRTDDSSRFVEGNEDDYGSDQVSKVPSRRPGQFPSRTEGEASFQGNRRRPGEQLPSRGSPDQLDDFDTYKEGSIYDKENDQSIFEPNKYRPVDKTMLRRPIPSVPSSYDQYVKSQDGADQNEQFENITDEDFDNKNRQVPNRIPSRQPGTKFNVVDTTLNTNVPKQPESKKSYDRYNQNIRRPQVTTFAPQTDDSRITRPGKLTSFDQNVRRPSMQLKPSEINGHTTDSSSINQGPVFAPEVIDSDINVPDITSLDQNIRQPIITHRPRPNEHSTIRPSDDQESTFIPQTERIPQYDDSRVTIPGKISTIDQHIRRPTFTQRPGQINQYTSTIKPNIGQDTLFTPRNESELDDSQTFEPGKNYQDIRRPASGQRPGNQNRYTTVKPIEGDSGYQYLPPQRKFEDIPKLPQNADHKTHSEQTEKVAKPFMTPDVSRYEEEYDDIEESKKPLRPSSRPGQKTEIGKRPVSQQDFRVYNKQNEPKYYDVTDTKPGENRMVINDLTRNYDEPDKYSTIGSTRLPSFQQTPTARPQQHQQFEPTTRDYEEVQNIPQRTTGLPQKSMGYFGGRDRDRTGIVPSSTPIPSQSKRFDVAQPVRKPGQQTTDRYISETQGYNTVSTTKMPLPGSSRFEDDSTKDFYQQTPLRPYQTTYKPMVTISDIDADKVRPGSEITSTRRPGFQTPARRPGMYSHGHVPSTTYRPGYFTETVEVEKKPIVDEFGRPVVGFNVIPGIEGTSIRPEIGSQNGRVPFTKGGDDKSEEINPDVREYGRPITPSEQQQKDSSFFPPYGEFSSTEKIIGEDFSGPKQPQRFDPERGYYY